ncbi:hypothetical protein A2153_00710, partial [Candidatus Gottesmanbacteria bacterium RBG_16_38_7b]
MKKLFWLWISILFVYLLFAGRGTFNFHTTKRNYFSLQAYSWLNGRLDLITLPKDVMDLSFYQGKAYLYWPPMPSLFILPFVSFFGVDVSDQFYTAFWASFVPVLFYLVLKEAKKVNFIPPISEKVVFLLALFFAFGTVFFSLSVNGNVWFTSQVISMIPLMSSLLFLFKFVYSRKYNDYLISIILMCFAFWGRNTLMVAILLHLYVLFLLPKFRLKKLLLLTLFILSLNFLLFGYFNYLRFGNFIENGLNLHKVNPRWLYDLKTYGILNIHYWPHNFYYYFLNPLGFNFQALFIEPDPEGNSIFSTSPLFLLILGSLFFGLFKKKRRLLLIYAVITTVSLIFLLSLFGSGWFQFGSRYLLDIIP